MEGEVVVNPKNETENRRPTKRMREKAEDDECDAAALRRREMAPLRLHSSTPHRRMGLLSLFRLRRRVGRRWIDVLEESDATDEFEEGILSKTP